MHTAEVVADTKLDNLPFFAHCSCGTEGRFRDEPIAYLWINRHLEEYGEPLIHPTEKVTAGVTAAETVATEQHEPRHAEQHEPPHRLRR